jgi:hypothetical protein
MLTNACSLRNKITEVTDLMSSHRPDVFGITETWLSDNILDSEVKIPCYTAVRADRVGGRAGGGCLLYIREGIKFTTLSLPENTFDCLDVVAVKIFIDRAPVIVVLVYRSPESTVEADLFLMGLLSNIENVNKLIFGDFNAPHINWELGSCPSAPSFDSLLLNYAEENFLRQIVSNPTRYRNMQLPSRLDLALVKFDQNYTEPVRLAPIGRSDHVVVSFRLLDFNVPRSDLRRVRKMYSRTDKITLNERARNLNWPTGSESVDDQWELIKNHIKELEAEFIPIKTFKPNNNQPWFNAGAKRRIRNRNLLWNTYISNRTAENYQRYKAARNNTHSYIRSKKADYEDRLVRNIKHDKKKYFAYIRSHRKNCDHIGSLKNSNGTLTASDVEAAGLLAKQFGSVFKQDNLNDAPPFALRTLQIMDDIIVTEEEVRSHLSKLKPSKSPGPDEIHPAMIKLLNDSLVPSITSLFNKSLSTGRIPGDWKLATITPLPKKGNKQEPANYRPVSLTSVLCKVLETIVRNRILTFLEREKLLNLTQHGFSSGRSCLTNLLTFMENLSKRIDEGDEIEAVYLDLSKAFDTVNHRLLLRKLESYGFSASTVTWVAGFLQERSLKVRVRNALSESISISSGVPQGSVLGPLLFLIYVNDLPDNIRSNCLLFADDIKIFGSTYEHDTIQTDLNAVSEWVMNWDLSINPLKSQHLSSPTIPPLSLSTGNNLVLIPKTTSVIDLGVQFNDNLTPSNQCFRAASKARSELFLLRRRFTNMSCKNFTILYSTFVRPHLEYCVQVWSPYLVGDVNHLERVQRQATRMVRSIRHLPYEQRLARLNLFSLRRRRLRGDLIETFKIVKQISRVDPNYFFTRSRTSQLRGHNFKLYKPRFRTRGRQFSFSNRVITPWNSLPAYVVNANNVKEFKNRLDRCWSVTFPEVP